MKAMQQNLNDWLRQKAHVVTGNPFQVGDFSCVPVGPENQQEADKPVGFLVTRGTDVTYVAAQTPAGEQMMSVWVKYQVPGSASDDPFLPAEYWYG